MQISSRFTLAVHIFACIDVFKDDYKVTSEFLAGSTNVNRTQDTGAIESGGTCGGGQRFRRRFYSEAFR